jgi:carboxyl-terminal processing protease
VLSSPATRRPRPFTHGLLRASRIAAICSVALVSPAVASTPEELDSEVLVRALRLVESNYLFADQLNPSRLFDEALSRLEVQLPKVHVTKADPAAYLVEVGPCELRLELAPDARLESLATPLGHVANLVERCLPERPKGSEQIETLLLNGLLGGLDPYSAVFDSQGSAEHTIQFRGQLAGVGARIGVRQEHLTMLEVYPESPAAKAGLRDGDKVLRIDGVSTTNLPVSDAVERIRGNPGTSVLLTVDRPGEQGHREFSVVRAIVMIPSVYARRLDSGAIYAEISHFSQTTPSDFRHRVEAAIGGAPVKGVLIDLRRNSGGSMIGASSIGDLFLDKGLLITTAGRNGATVSGLTAEIDATPGSPFRDLPVAVLTSSHTASGSELLAACLRNNDRAVLIGDRTFGKGTVQKTYGLGKDASLKLTVGHFLPNGLSIPGGGLQPDVEVRRLRFAKDGLGLPVRAETADLPFWLRTPSWLTASTIEPSAIIDLVETVAAEQTDEPIDENAVLERERSGRVVDLAAELLVRFGSPSAEQTLAHAANWLRAYQAEADAQVTADLNARGLDWRKPDAIGALASAMSPKLSVRLESPPGGLRAGEESEITIAVTNDSDRPHYRLYGALASQARFLRGYGLLFGYLAPGATNRWSVRVKPPVSLETSRIEFNVELRSDTGLSLESTPLHLTVAPAERPHLAFRTAVVDAPEGERTHLLRIDVQNRGEGTASDVRFFLKHPDEEDIELVDSSKTIESLAGGEQATVELGLRLLRSREQPAQVELTISEAEFRIGLVTEVPVGGAPTEEAWREPPQIRVGSLLALGEGTYELIAEVTDDEGVAAYWTFVGGKQTDYIEAGPGLPRHMQVSIPWSPNDGVKQFELVAEDTDGLTTRYTADL